MTWPAFSPRLCQLARRVQGNQARLFRIFPKQSPSDYWDTHGPLVIRLLQTNDLEKAKSIIKERVLDQPWKQKRTLGKELITFLRWNAFPEVAEWVYRSMSKDELKIDEMTPAYDFKMYEEVVAGYLWLGQWQRAVELAEPLPDSHQLPMALYSQLALLSILGITPINATPRHVSAEHVIEEMQAKLSLRHLPLASSNNWSNQLYFWIIRTLSRLDNLPAARGVFECMWSVYRQPADTPKEHRYLNSIYDLLMRAYGLPANQGGRGDASEAMVLFRHCQSTTSQTRNKGPAASIYATLVRIRSSSFDDLDDILHDLGKLPSPSHDLATEIVLAHCRMRDADGALVAMKRIQQDWGLTLGAPVYSKVSTVLLEQGRYSEAQAVLHQLFDSYEQVKARTLSVRETIAQAMTYGPAMPPPTSHVLSAAVTSNHLALHPMRKRPTRQARLYTDPDAQQLESDPVRLVTTLMPNTVIYNNLLAIKAAQGDVAGARRVLAQIRDARPRLSPTHRSHLLLIQAYSAAGESPLPVLQELRADKLEPNSFIWDALLMAEAKLDPIRATNLTLHAIDQAGYAPDVALISTLKTRLQNGPTEHSLSIGETNSVVPHAGLMTQRCKNVKDADDAISEMPRRAPSTPEIVSYSIRQIRGQ